MRGSLISGIAVAMMVCIVMSRERLIVRVCVNIVVVSCVAENMLFFKMSVGIRRGKG